MLTALGYWGFQLGPGWAVRVLAGLGAPLLAAVVWGTWVAPKAANQMADPARFAVELMLFTLGAGALSLAGRPGWGAALLVAFLVNRLLLFLAER